MIDATQGHNMLYFYRYWSLKDVFPKSWRMWSTSAALGCALMAAAIPAQAQNMLPQGYTQCAIERQHCYFNGRATVVYGTGSTWTAPRAFTNGVSCENTVFGDPAYKKNKFCYFKSASVEDKPPPGFTVCAAENQSCNPNGSAKVIYGAQTAWVGLPNSTNGGVTTSVVPCNNATFGDPLVGVRKRCYFKSVPAPSTNTAAALAEFWKRYGAPESFPPMYVDLLENVLKAEDRVLAKDYQGARTIVDTLLIKYPLTSPLWWADIYWTGQNKSTRPHLGEPGIYAHLRMLDEITSIGIHAALVGRTPIQLTVVTPACSDITPLSGPSLLNHRLSPEIEANSYEVLHQSLRLFQSYVLAITGGELRLEVKFHKMPQCFEFNVLKSLADSSAAQLSLLPAEVVANSDMFWLLYPSDYEAVAKIGIGMNSGLTSFGGRPVFISEDDWVIKKVASQGAGARTEVERRVYLPEWFQHEFFHYLFGSWPELGLEKSSHQWNMRNTWPADFVGDLEEDYYAEALRKRFYRVTPNIAQKLKRSALR
jgi:hypothetical protein